MIYDTQEGVPLRDAAAEDDEEEASSGSESESESASSGSSGDEEEGDGAAGVRLAAAAMAVGVGSFRDPERVQVCLWLRMVGGVGHLSVCACGRL